jgi:hypothetical protein
MTAIATACQWPVHRRYHQSPAHASGSQGLAGDAWAATDWLNELVKI